MSTPDFSVEIQQLCAAIRDRQQREDTEDELCGHLQDTYERNLAVGQDETQARQAALDCLGDLNLLRERLGAVHSFSPQHAMNASLGLYFSAFILSTFQETGILYPIVHFTSVLLMLLSLLRLRTVNRGLQLGFYIYCVSVILQAVQTAFYVCDSGIPAIYVLPICGNLAENATLIAVWLGFHALRRQVAPNSPNPPRLLLCMAVIVGINLVSLILTLSTEKQETLNSYISTIILPVYYYYSMTQMNKLKKILWDVNASYGIKPLKARKIAFIAAILLFFTACPQITSVIYINTPPEKSVYTAADTQETTQADRIRNKMVALGLPPEIAVELPNSEIMRYKNTIHMTYREIDGVESKSPYKKMKVYTFFCREQQNDIFDYTTRTLIQLKSEPDRTTAWRLIQLHYGDERNYRYIDLMPLTNGGSQPFALILTRDGEALQAAKPRNLHFEDYEWYGNFQPEKYFSFQPEENQTVYFAVTDGFSPQLSHSTYQQFDQFYALAAQKHAAFYCFPHLNSFTKKWYDRTYVFDFGKTAQYYQFCNELSGADLGITTELTEE